MTATNFERAQGETWRVLISLEDSNTLPLQLADESFVASLFFSGVAKKTGQTSIPILMQFSQPETKTWGRGAQASTATGVYSFYAYLPADTTTSMEAGVWEYVIRMSDSENPSGLDSSKNILKGNLTITASVIDLSDGDAFEFNAPTTPTAP